MSRPRSTGPRYLTRLAVAAAATVLLVACGTPGASTTESTTAAPSGTVAGSSGAAATGDPIKVGIVTSLSGPLQSYGQMYLDAFNVGLDYATDGTGAVNGRTIEVTTADDAGDPAKATTAATDFIGQGYQIIAGSASSGVGLQVAPLAARTRCCSSPGRPPPTD